ncbi:MAG: recombinase family protein [Pseudomonadota bacterium]|nr:recombinase family protein [Pseudomonadota bacterium]
MRRTNRTRNNDSSEAGSTPKVPTKRTAVLYARVSSRDQEREGFSIPAQQKLIRDYAEAHDLKIIEEFTDVETAKRSGRTAFTKMLTLLRKQKSNRSVILVEKTDRLYRNLKDWVTLDELQVVIHLVKEGAVLSEDSRSSEKFMHGIKVLMAKNYVDNLSEEVRKGQTQKADEGHWPSSAPLGYLNVRENGKSYIQLDPQRALLVKTIFEEHATGGHSMDGLADYAARIGLTSKKGHKIHKSNIHHMLRNPIYAGEFVWKGKTYKGKDPAIVSMAVFRRVQSRLDGFPDTRPAARDFAFQGLLRCAHCGAAMTAEIKKQKYTYYRCAQLCENNAYIREEKVSDMLAEQVIKPLRMPPEVRKWAVTALKGSKRDIELETEERVAVARKEQDRIARLRSKAYDEKLEGRVDTEFFDAKRREWDERLGELREELDRLDRVNVRCLDRAVQILELASEAYDLYKSETMHERGQFIAALTSNCELSKDCVRPTYRKPYSDLAELASEPENSDDGIPASEVPRPGWLGR